MGQANHCSPGDVPSSPGVKHYDACNQETNRNTSLDDVAAIDRTLHE